MNDGLKDLTAQQLARLIQYAEGGANDEQMDGARLHEEKNAPWVNGAYSSYRPPPYVFKAYPKWLFTADWIRADAEWRNALGQRGRRGDENMRELREQMVIDAAAARDACMRLVQGPEEEKALGSEWHESPTGAVERREQLARLVAGEAAASNWDDRRMSPAAQAERAALDAASETHLTDVPRTPIKKTQKAE